MNSFIETLNQWGGNFLSFAWPMLWQSSLLIVVLLAFDFLFRRKLRASIRYALWLVVLVKLCVPPALALPTSPAWWLHKTPPPVVAKPEAPHYTVTYDNGPLPEIPQSSLPAFIPPKPVMTNTAWLLVFSASISAALLFWLLMRWGQITRQVRRAASSERLDALTDEAQKFVGMKFKVQVKLTANSMSPAVCGLFRQAILIPQSLAENFSDEQLRAVLLHELIHLRRRDVWLNFLQSLLQIFYWWHPLVWLANARIRRVREEAVDDAVMLALRDEAEAYAPTLLEVAKLALNRPLASLGLVGILESRHALRQRIERLVDFRPPRQAGLTLVSLLGILAFTAVAVPMGGAPEKTTNPILPDIGDNLNQTNSSISATANLSNSNNATQSLFMVAFKINGSIDENSLKKSFQDSGMKIPPTVFFYKDNGMLLVRGSKEQLALVDRAILKANGVSPKDIQANDKQFLNEGHPIGFEDSTNLFERSFKVDANTFPASLRKQAGLQTDSASGVALAVRNFFSKLGVDLESPKGKTVFYGYRLGMLFVKATASDLDTIERAIQALNYTPPYVHIKARFLEVPNNTLQGFVAPNLFTNAAVQSGTNIWPERLTGLLTDKNFKAVLRALESKPGTMALAEPDVTTMSGRQTQMRATQVITVITNFTFQENGTNGSIISQTENIETGPVLDVVPYVLSDGYTINLALIPSLTEFLGYDKPTNTTAAYNRAGEKIDVPKVIPKFRVRQVVATVNVLDGQTVVFSGLPEKNYVSGKETVEKSKASDKELLVFITVTLVDPTGNRIHVDEELPFAQEGIPPQPPQPK
jgi:beta-lactamase regulating signal transducer with metallopeptidase domain